MKEDNIDNNIVIELKDPDSDCDSVSDEPISLPESLKNHTDGLKKLSTSLAEYTYHAIGMDDCIEHLSKKMVEFSKTAIESIKTSAMFGNSLAELSRKVLESTSKALQSFSASVIVSPLLDALRNVSIDYSAILKKISDAQSFSKKFDELKEMQMQVLYEAHWFPYATLLTDLSDLIEINDIISSTRTGSKNREKKIDDVLLSFFTENKVKEIKSEIWQMDLEYWQKRAISQAINAHFRKEYILTISCLAPMWETRFDQAFSIKKHSNDKGNKKYKSEIADLLNDNGFDKALSDFYNNMIIGTCYKPEETKEGVPNRNGIAHGWYLKYPNKKASLNAILLTYFILKLEPINQTEENENG